MAVESATYISDFDVTYPLAGDPRSAGDDHLRLIKAVLKNTFPNISAAVTVTAAEINVLAALIPAGTKIPFYQASPPAGWSAVTVSGANDYMMRVVPAAGTAGTFGGSHNPVLMNVVPSHSHSNYLTGSVWDTGHAHTAGAPNNGSSGYAGSGVPLFGGNTGVAYAAITNNLSVVNVGNAGASNWMPRYADFCVGEKS